MNKDTTIVLNELATNLLAQATDFNNKSLDCENMEVAMSFATSAMTLTGFSRALSKTIENLNK